MRSEFLRDWRWLITFGLMLAGCSRLSGNIEVPEWDPAAAADQALTEYDSNGDRKLSGDELKKCPGLLSGISAFDRDGDGSLSHDEIRTTLDELNQDQAALVEITCEVTRNGRPLEGATVKFVPESFMGDALKPAVGVTARDGTAFPTIAGEELPEEFRGRVHGIHCGVFRVEITHPNVAIPEKYNTKSELGRLVTRRDREPLTVNF
jgi:hypothetical protein